MTALVPWRGYAVVLEQLEEVHATFVEAHAASAEAPEEAGAERAHEAGGCSVLKASSALWSLAAQQRNPTFALVQGLQAWEDLQMTSQSSIAWIGLMKVETCSRPLRWMTGVTALVVQGWRQCYCSEAAEAE